MTPSSDALPILSVRKLSTGYGKKQVLFDVTLDVMPGEIVLITGGNGSGKSTLLKAIYGLLPPWNADAEILYRPLQNGEVLSTNVASNNLAQGLAYLPQKNAVFDDLTVEDNLRLAGHILRGGKGFASRRDEVLSLLPMLAPMLKRKPEKMSGGERQMAALGMAMLHRPRLLLLDEPTAGLDSKNAAMFLDAIHSAQEKNLLSFIVVEHRKYECQSLGGRLCRMRLGVLDAKVTVQDELKLEVL
ncbi:MAG: ATP-binding cassette domain-containing protein [Anaerolineales bacterium]